MAGPVLAPKFLKEIEDILNSYVFRQEKNIVTLTDVSEDKYRGKGDKQ